MYGNKLKDFFLDMYYTWSSSPVYLWILLCIKNYLIRRNLIENWAISGFSKQKSGTRIILSIQSFLHFCKAEYINNCLKSHWKQFPCKLEKINFKVHGTQAKFHHQFHFTRVFHMKFIIHIWHLLLILFEKIRDCISSSRSGVCNMMYLIILVVHIGFCPHYSNVWWILS